jgi:hypothetical protein
VKTLPSCLSVSWPRQRLAITPLPSVTINVGVPRTFSESPSGVGRRSPTGKLILRDERFGVFKVEPNERNPHPPLLNSR